MLQKSKAEKFIATLHEGDKVTIYFNPEKSKKANELGIIYRITPNYVRVKSFGRIHNFNRWDLTSQGSNAYLSPNSSWYAKIFIPENSGMEK